MKYEFLKPAEDEFKELKKIALKGHDIPAQGNALGTVNEKNKP